MNDFEDDYKDDSWSKKDIFLLTYAILINIFTLGLILYFVF